MSGNVCLRTRVCGNVTFLLPITVYWRLGGIGGGRSRSSPKRAQVCWITLKSHLSFWAPAAGKGEASTAPEIVAAPTGSGGGVPVIGCGRGLPLRNDILLVDDDETRLMAPPPPPPMGLNPAAAIAFVVGLMMDLVGAWWKSGVDDGGGIEDLLRAFQPFQVFWMTVAASFRRPSRILSSCCLAPSLRKTCFLPWAHAVLRGIGMRAVSSSTEGAVHSFSFWL